MADHVGDALVVAEMMLMLQIAGGIVLGFLALVAICTAPERYRRWKERRAMTARYRK